MLALDKYDSIEFTLATGQTNYDVRANEANAYNKIAIYRRVEIRTNVNITIKLNSTSNSAITISLTDSPYTIEWLEITNIFITNASGSTASIKIIATE